MPQDNGFMDEPVSIFKFTSTSDGFVTDLRWNNTSELNLFEEELLVSLKRAISQTITLSSTSAVELLLDIPTYSSQPHVLDTKQKIARDTESLIVGAVSAALLERTTFELCKVCKLTSHATSREWFPLITDLGLSKDKEAVKAEMRRILKAKGYGEKHGLLYWWLTYLMSMMTRPSPSAGLSYLSLMDMAALYMDLTPEYHYYSGSPVLVRANRNDLSAEIWFRTTPDRGPLFELR